MDEILVDDLVWALLSSRSILGHGRLYTGAYSCQSQGRLNTIQ